MRVTSDDFERLTVSSTDLTQDPEGHLFHRQFGRFEPDGRAVNDPSLGMRKEWKYGYWLEEGWATVIFARAFLVDRDEDFELFYDVSYPTDWGGWVIFTDYHKED